MRRIESCFQRLAGQNRKALIPFVTAGDPVKEVTVPLMHAMVDAGADIIELGVPFSDPMADGPVIQLACERALAHNTSTRDILGMVKAFRETNTDTPVVLMGYLNPVEVMGYEAFAKAAAAGRSTGSETGNGCPGPGHDFPGRAHYLGCPYQADWQSRLRLSLLRFSEGRHRLRNPQRG